MTFGVLPILLRTKSVPDSMAPPPELTPPVGGDQNRAHELLGASWTLFAISACLVAARMYTRLVVQKNAGWDDWIICLTLVSFRYLRWDFRLLTVNVGVRTVFHDPVHRLRCPRWRATYVLLEPPRNAAGDQVQLHCQRSDRGPAVHGQNIRCIAHPATSCTWREVPAMVSVLRLREPLHSHHVRYHRDSVPM
jgi:hypothetical protein